MGHSIVNDRELKAALARKGLRQWQLAFKLEMSPSALTAALTGRTRPRDDLLARIAQELGISVERLREDSDGV